MRARQPCPCMRKHCERESEEIFQLHAVSKEAERRRTVVHLAMGLDSAVALEFLLLLSAERLRRRWLGIWSRERKPWLRSSACDDDLRIEHRIYVALETSFSLTSGMPPEIQYQWHVNSSFCQSNLRFRFSSCRLQLHQYSSFSTLNRVLLCLVWKRLTILTSDCLEAQAIEHERVFSISTSLCWTLPLSIYQYTTHARESLGRPLRPPSPSLLLSLCSSFSSLPFFRSWLPSCPSPFPTFSIPSPSSPLSSIFSAAKHCSHTH